MARHELLRTAQEAISNAVRHAGNSFSTVISVSVRILESPKPSPPTNCGSAMPEPLSVTSMTRFGASSSDADADNGGLGVANRVADGFLGNP